MKISPFAGKPAELSMLVDVPRLITAYYTETPDVSVREERVKFGTSGHRGSAFDRSFNEHHILAISQAICLYRRHEKIDGPLFLGMDTRKSRDRERVVRRNFNMPPYMPQFVYTSEAWAALSRKPVDRTRLSRPLPRVSEEADLAPPAGNRRTIKCVHWASSTPGRRTKENL